MSEKTTQTYTLKSITAYQNREKHIKNFNESLRGQKWTFSVKALNKNHEGRVISATLHHPEFENYVALNLDGAPNILKKLQLKQGVTGGVTVGFKKNGKLGFLFNLPQKTSGKKKKPPLPGSTGKPKSPHQKTTSPAQSIPEKPQFFSYQISHIRNICFQYNPQKAQKSLEWVKKNLPLENQKLNTYINKLIKLEATKKTHDTPVQQPRINITERKDTIQKITIEIEKINAEITPENVEPLFKLCRKRELSQLRHVDLTDQYKRSKLETILKDEEFDGTIEDKGAGIAWIRSPYFFDRLRLRIENLQEGAIKKNASISFQIMVSQNTNTGQFIYEAINAISQAYKEDVSGVVLTVKKWHKQAKKICSAGKPVLIVPSKTEEDARANKDSAINKCPAGFHISRFDELDKNFYPTIYPYLPEKCLVALPQKAKDGFIQKCLKDAVAQWSFPIIASEEKKCWTVVMDETGNCRDHTTSQAHPSVMMAVIIPPGSCPPPCPTGYHSIESDRAINLRLRQEFINDENIFCIGWIYQSGKPYAYSEIQSDLHLQMWRNALVLCLEIIAQETNTRNSTGKVPVKVYVENVGKLTPGSKVLEGFMVDLVDNLQKRSGWKNLAIKLPCIVAKDEHPYVGYVDTLGHVFRTDKSRMTDTDLLQVASIHGRRKTFILPYDADALQNLVNCIRQSGSSPYQSLVSLANSPEKYIRPYGRALLKPLAQTLFDELYPIQLDRLCSLIQDNLSKTPKLYFSNALLSECISQDKLNTLGIELRTAIYLNKLAVVNYRGDADGAQNILQKLTPLLAEISFPGLLYRFHAQIIDYHQNCLDFKKAETYAETFLSAARQEDRMVETAPHAIGAHFLTLALSGKTDKAKEYWEYLFPLQRNIEDRLRYHTYLVNLLLDQADWAGAQSIVKKISEEYAPLPTLCIDNYYLLATILKLEAHQPFLANSDKKNLLSIPSPGSHPGQLIDFWKFQLMKNSGIPLHIDKIKEMIEKCARIRCNALRLIHACLREQLVQDGDCNADFINVESLDTLRQSSQRTNKYLDTVANLGDKPYRWLQPLRFNYW